MNNQYNDPWKHPRPYEHPYETSKSKSVTKAVTLEDLFPKLDRWAIGFDPVFATLKQLSNAKAASYPPYNITKFGDGKFELQLALAGFRKEDLDITVEDRVLTVSSEVVEDDNPAFGEVIHHGIAQRNFTQNFALAEYVEVESAKMEDGILTIKLITNLPEEKKPKSVDIH
jgi:molecular chaperone IbpA